MNADVGKNINNTQPYKHMLYTHTHPHARTYLKQAISQKWMESAVQVKDE